MTDSRRFFRERCKAQEAVKAWSDMDCAYAKLFDAKEILRVVADAAHTLCNDFDLVNPTYDMIAEIRAKAEQAHNSAVEAMEAWERTQRT